MVDIYCHQYLKCSVIPLNVEHLKVVLLRDTRKLEKLFEHLAYRYIIANTETLKEF
jgi:hypothetical protein